MTTNPLVVRATPLSRYCVEYDGEPLYTSMGRHPVSHSSRMFLENMVIELDTRGQLVVQDGMVVSPLGFDSYNLLGLQREWVETGRDNFSADEFLHSLLHDGTLGRPPLPIYARQVGHYGVLVEWLSTLGARLIDLDFVDFDELDGVPDGYVRLSGALGDEDTLDFKHLFDVMQSLLGQMTLQQRSAAVYLSNITKDSVLFSLCLVAGGCSVEQYASGVAARDLPEDSSLRAKGHQQELERLAETAMRFVQLASGEIR